MFFSSMVRSRLLQHTTTFLGWFLLDIVLLCSYPLTGKNFENNFCSNILWKFFQFKFFLCPHEKMSLCMYFWQQYYRSKCILASALNEGYMRLTHMIIGIINNVLLIGEIYTVHLLFLTDNTSIERGDSRQCSLTLPQNTKISEFKFNLVFCRRPHQRKITVVLTLMHIFHLF